VTVPVVIAPLGEEIFIASECRDGGDDARVHANLNRQCAAPF
jgi:hypothetical protein